MSKTANGITKRKTYLIGLLFRASYYKIIGKDMLMTSTIADGFLRLGGVYTKFLQGVLLQIPLMKLWQSKNRFSVYENVPIDSIDVRTFLSDHVPAEKRRLIYSVETTPFASGSFGQVYKGKLKTGEDLAIKILRPNTRKLLKKDLRFIRVVSGLLASSFTNWNIDLRTLTKDFTRSTLTETNYVAEAKFAQESYAYYESHPQIVIPKTYVELCSQYMIVQEYIEGISIAKLLQINQDHEIDYAQYVSEHVDSDLRTQLILLGTELNRAILSGGPVHGDPHPGNIRLLPNNRVALLDFGIRAQQLKSPSSYYGLFKEYWRAEYDNQTDPGKMFLSQIRLYSSRLYDSMLVVSKYASERYNKKIELDSFIIKIGNKTFRKLVSEETLQAGLERIKNGDTARDISVNEIINKNNRFQVTAKINDSSVLRVGLTFISLLTELGYRSALPTIYNNVVEYVERDLPELLVVKEPSISLSDAIEIVYSWLEKISQHDVELYYLLKRYLNGLQSDT